MKKRHHYLPKFYLEEFVDPRNSPYIWIYEKGQSQIRKANATNIAVKKDFYTYTTIYGKRDPEGMVKGVRSGEHVAQSLICHCEP